MSLSLSNAHARATVLSAVWSPADQQLVAVLMAATDKTVLKALKAELEKHNKHSQVIRRMNQPLCNALALMSGPTRACSRPPLPWRSRECVEDPPDALEPERDRKATRSVSRSSR